MVQSAGIVPQDERREPYTVTTPIELKMGETVMTLFPDEAFKISCTSADKQGRFTQFYSVELSPATWERDLAHARTFCFYEEIEYLINNGLIKGGSLENAVVIRDVPGGHLAVGVPAALKPRKDIDARLIEPLTPSN